VSKETRRRRRIVGAVEDVDDVIPLDMELLATK
jgi:hypothetical protein